MQLGKGVKTQRVVPLVNEFNSEVNNFIYQQAKKNTKTPGRLMKGNEKQRL